MVIGCHVCTKEVEDGRLDIEGHSYNWQEVRHKFELLEILPQVILGQEFKRKLKRQFIKAMNLLLSYIWN